MEEGKILIPAIIQDYRTREVLMLAYMDRVSLKKSIEEGNTWFWSRSRNRLWKKGETSGNIQTIKDIKYDCDNDAILILVDQKGPACHTMEPASRSEIIKILYDVVKERIAKGKKGSYTFSLHDKGLDEILKKFGEEAIEVILAAKHQKKEDIIYEISDLIYHLLVLMGEKDIDPGQVYDELKSRRK